MHSSIHQSRLRFPLQAGLLLLAGLSACNDPQTTQPSTRTTQKPVPPAQVATMRDPNVLGVSAHYNSFDPWLWNAARDKPQGVRVSIYLLDSNYKGVFGDGIIRPRLYVREIDAKGETTWRLAKEWAFPPEKTIPWRSKQPRVWGWGYGLPLPWDELSQLAGREVRMIVEFERADGRRVTSRKHDFRVPTPSNA